MNIRYFQGGLLLTLLLASSLAMAELKLGYVNANVLLEKAPQAQAAAQRMKEEFSPRESSLMSGKSELEEMQKRLGRDADVMSEDKAKALRLEILSRQRELVRDEEALRQDLAIRRSDVVNTLQVLVRTAVEEVGKRGHYDIIFYDGIAYGNPALDLTDQVLEELKKADKKSSK